MGEAILYGKSGGGGLKINSIIEEYYVYAGENISAGDFVSFIQGVAGNVVVDTSLTALAGARYGYYMQACKLSDTRVVVSTQTSHDSCLRILLIGISQGVLTVLTEVVADSSGSVKGLRPEIIALDSTRFVTIYAYSSSYYMYGIAGQIADDDTITLGTKTRLVSDTNDGYFKRMVLSSTDKIFIAYGDESSASSCYLKGVVVTVNDVTLTAGSVFNINSTGYSSYISLAKLQDDKIFVAHSSGSSQLLYGRIITISGTSATIGTVYKVANETNCAICHSSLKIADDKVFVAYGTSGTGTTYTLRGVIVTVNFEDNTISVGTNTNISIVKNSGLYTINTNLLPNGNVLVTHNSTDDSILCYTTCSISDGVITPLSTNNEVDGSIHSGFEHTALRLGDDILVLYPWYSDSSLANYMGELYGYLLGVDSTDESKLTNKVDNFSFETQVKKATTLQFDGVAKTSGTGGTETEHNQTVQIYTL